MWIISFISITSNLRKHKHTHNPHEILFIQYRWCCRDGWNESQTDKYENQIRKKSYSNNTSRFYWFFFFMITMNLRRRRKKHAKILFPAILSPRNNNNLAADSLRKQFFFAMTVYSYIRASLLWIWKRPLNWNRRNSSS